MEFVLFLVTSSVIAGGIALVALGVGKLPGWAPLARWLWLFVLLKLVTPPIFEVESKIWSPNSRRVPSAAVIAGSPGPAREIPLGPPGAPLEFGAQGTESLERYGFTALVLLWGVGAFLTLGLGWRRARRCQELVERADPASHEVLASVAAVARRVGLGTVPRVRVVDAPVSPFVWSYRGPPIIVLPRSILGFLGTDDREAILAHELAHLANRDHVWRWIEFFILALHWWNPLARFACRRLHESTELCCDARAMQSLSLSARAYGGAILRAAECLGALGSRVPKGAMGLGSADSLKRRIVMITSTQLQHRLSWTQKLCVAGLAFLVLPLGLQAQEKEEKGSPDGEQRVVTLKDAKVTVQEATDATGPQTVILRNGDQTQEIHLAPGQRLVLVEGLEGAKPKHVMRFDQGARATSGDGADVKAKDRVLGSDGNTWTVYGSGEGGYTYRVAPKGTRSTGRWVAKAPSSQGQWVTDAPKGGVWVFGEEGGSAGANEKKKGGVGYWLEDVTEPSEGQHGRDSDDTQETIRDLRKRLKKLESELQKLQRTLPAGGGR